MKKVDIKIELNKETKSLLKKQIFKMFILKLRNDGNISETKYNKMLSEIDKTKC